MKGSSSGNVKTLQMRPHSDECEGKLYFCCLPFLFIPLEQRFSIPVLAPPHSAYFVCFSYRFRCLFYSNVSALRSGHHSIFRHDSSSKRTYIFHSKCIEVCKTWIKIVYIYRGIWCHTRPCVKTLRSANPWMNVPKWSKLQRISPAQGVGSNGHCVGSMSIGTQFMHEAHF